ncbi:hypothetical protein B4Q13_15710 [Lacticaseibacillus rhamnosus]
MEIHYHDIVRQPPEREKGAIFHDTLDSLLAVSDVLSINAPSTPEPRLDAATWAAIAQSKTVERSPNGGRSKWGYDGPPTAYPPSQKTKSQSC